jgi:DEAD/DEAH box helicase
MVELDQKRIEMVDELIAQIANRDSLTATQARSFVKGLQTEWEVPPIQWSEPESQSQLRDARSLIEAASIIREIEGDNSSKLSSCYRRAGELVEWLIRGQSAPETFVPLEFLAAGAYQLGGLSAMAVALLRQINQDQVGERLYSKFLAADFDGVIQSATEFWRVNLDIAHRKAKEEILQSDDDDKTSWYFSIELVRTLGCIADSLRSGDEERLDLAIAKLAALEKVAVRALSDDASVFVMLLYQVALSFRNSSIYRPIQALADTNPKRSSQIRYFARKQFSRGKGILWVSQLHGIDRLLRESSFALCTPTGSGKTLVANLALVKELILKQEEDKAPLAMYLVPSRALAGEVEAKLTDELGQDLIVTGLYGGTDWGITDYWLESNKPTVLIATVEKADALMRHIGPILQDRLRLLIIDEAHQVVPDDINRAQLDFAEHTSRSIRLESFVSRVLAQSPEIARIALTAVAGGAAPTVARWIEGSNEAIAVGTNYRSSRQIVGVLETHPLRADKMQVHLMDGRRLVVQDRGEPIYIPLRTPVMPELPPAMRNSIYRFNELSVLWTSLHLIEGDRRILISIAQQPEKSMGWYKQALELPEWQEALTFEPPENARERGLFEETRAACADYCGEDSYELALLDQGIASNYGQMPQRLRRLMTNLIEHGICPITVATATLTEGVNLPFDIIFITALKRQTFDQENGKQVEIPISTAEFRNLIGRAGRPGSSNSMEGIALVALPQRPSTTAPQSIGLQQSQIRRLKAEYYGLVTRLLEEEIEEAEVDSPLTLLLHYIAKLARELLNLDGDDFINWLDAVTPPDISDNAGCAEPSTQSRLADSVDELDGILLSSIQEISRIQDNKLEGRAVEEVLTRLWQSTFSAYSANQEEWLETVFVRRGCAVIDNIYPNEDERNRLYHYGFTPYVGRLFDAVRPAIKAVICEAQTYGTANERERLGVFILLGELLADDPGYGFRIRNTVTDRDILEQWKEVLAWWMHMPEADNPAPKDLRSWQRFISDNIDFRLGVAIGAVVACAWSEGAGEGLSVPSLDVWKETTGLPWFGFWARELLRWGTLDPFVAFSLAQGLATTRMRAAELRPTFEEWLSTEHGELDSEDQINPQYFLAWHRNLSQSKGNDQGENSVAAELCDTTGEKGHYRVTPIDIGDKVNWIDAAGYLLATSIREQSPFSGNYHKQDFELSINGQESQVVCNFESQ